MRLFKTLLIHTALVSSGAFLAPATFRSRRLQLFSSSGNDDLDAMRRLLQSSWNSDTMGSVPSDATAAANEAYASILSASENGQNMFFVNLLLPAYDITQGHNLYDEVLAVEYCIALSKCLKGKTSIVVRDDKTLQVVGRVLDARERDAVDDYEEDDDDDDDDLEEEEEDAEFDDDFDENTASEDSSAAPIKGTIGESQTSTSTPTPDSAPVVQDVDSFRQQLMSNWDGGSVADEPKQSAPVRKPRKEKLSAMKRYRLTSFFGNQQISMGSDMMNDVIKAVRENALPTEDEETIIILSAASREEIIAVRSLAAKYGGKKRIVMVNCNLTPIPKELTMAETVYSILPLMARQKVSERNISGIQQPDDDQPAPPKIVVMRRYPRDWEVFVDVGKGFELAESAPEGSVGKKGPSMEWIGEVINKFLQSRSL
jgi:hypothetical protein